MARNQYGDDINPYDLSHVAAVRKGTLYPTPREPHSAADLLRPLAADNARLQRERNAMEARIAELEAQRETLLAACEAALGGTGAEQNQRRAMPKQRAEELREWDLSDIGVHYAKMVALTQFSFWHTDWGKAPDYHTAHVDMDAAETIIKERGSNPDDYFENLAQEYRF